MYPFRFLGRTEVYSLPRETCLASCAFLIFFSMFLYFCSYKSEKSLDPFKTIFPECDQGNDTLQKGIFLSKKLKIQHPGDIYAGNSFCIGSEWKLYLSKRVYQSSNSSASECDFIRRWVLSRGNKVRMRSLGLDLI